MKEIEVTYEVYNTLEELKLILEKNDCTFIKEFMMNDIYFYNKKTNEFNIENGKIGDTLLIRSVDNKEFKIVCKKRIYNTNNVEVSNQKQIAKIHNVQDAIMLFEQMGYSQYLTVYNHSYKYKTTEYDIYIQCIKDLGIFLEIESSNESSENIDDDSMVSKLITYTKSFNLKLGNNYKARKAELLYNNNVSRRYFYKINLFKKGTSNYGKRIGD